MEGERLRLVGERCRREPGLPCRARRT